MGLHNTNIKFHVTVQFNVALQVQFVLATTMPFWSNWISRRPSKPKDAGSNPVKGANL